MDAKNKINLLKDMDDTLKVGGYLSHHFDGYSPRIPQIQAINAIATAYTKSLNASGKTHHAIIEAGTGTGKSFATLLPLATMVARRNAARKEGDRQIRGIIVAPTTTLQKQLFNDVSTVQNVLADMGLSIKAALYKGKGNYICTSRLIKTLNKTPQSIAAEMDTLLAEISDENQNLRLEMCDKEALPSLPSEELWNKININMDSSCADCPYRKEGCYYHYIRDDAKDADIIIGNHALLMQDLKCRLKIGRGSLPEYDYVVIDEAHHVELGLAEDFSSKVEMVNLWGIGKTCDWVIKHPLTRESQRIILKKNYEAFRNEVLKVFDFFKKQCGGESIPWNHHVMPKGINLRDTAQKLCETIALILMNLGKTDYSDRNKMNGLINRINTLKSDLLIFIYRSKETENFFFNIKYDNKEDTVSLLITPLNGGELMRKVLFSRVPVVILSATIKVGENLNVFGQKIGDLSPDEFEQLVVSSPFDYDKNAMFYVPQNALGAKDKGYDDYCISEMKRLVDLSKGSAFLLFTSKSTLEQYYKVLAPYFKSKGYSLFKQGDADRKTLVERFRKADNAVLFGGDSFWEGVDVAGEDLTLVVMHKLPFATPDPITAAKEALINARGRNGFVECTVFSAIIKFKQGVGRLIRKETDHGVVALLDARIFSSSFGKHFIKGLPEGIGKTVYYEDLAPYFVPREKEDA